jgi:hypothetical protein
MRRIAVRLTGAALAAAVALAILWYWASPWWTLWRIREAARAGDAAALAAYIDRDAVRAYARAQARADWDALMRTGQRDGSEADHRFRAFARQNLAETERLASDPGEYRAWLGALPVRFGRIGFAEEGGRVRLVRHGLSGFALRYDAGDDRSPRLTFRRKGLGWRLTAIRWGQQ